MASLKFCPQSLVYRTTRGNPNKIFSHNQVIVHGENFSHLKNFRFRIEINKWSDYVMHVLVKGGTT